MGELRAILLGRLHRLMKAQGWVRPDGEWDISKLHDAVKGSRRWLYRLVRGESNFTIDEYERILEKGFGLPLDSILFGPTTSSPPRDVADLYENLAVAIDNAKQTGTLPPLRFALTAIFDKTARDRALYEKAHSPPGPSPRVKQEARGDPNAGSVPTKPKHRKSS